MNTEHEIIYGLLGTLRDSEYNNDERVDERFLRALLLKYRADSIRKHLHNGARVSDDLFQTVRLTLEGLNNLEYQSKYPKIITLENDSGFYLMKNGMNISILQSETYSLSKKTFHGRLKAKAYMDGYTVKLFRGNIIDANFVDGSESFQIVKDFIDEISNGGGGIGQGTSTFSVTADLKAILYDPKDGDNYNWEEDPYPFPAERMNELTTQLLVKEFNFPQSVKRDEIQNARADEIRYHENNRVDGGGREME